MPSSDNRDAREIIGTTREDGEGGRIEPVAAIGKERFLCAVDDGSRTVLSIGEILSLESVSEEDQLPRTTVHAPRHFIFGEDGGPTSGYGSISEYLQQFEGVAGVRSFHRDDPLEVASIRGSSDRPGIVVFTTAESVSDIDMDLFMEFAAAHRYSVWPTDSGELGLRDGDEGTLDIVLEPRPVDAGGSEIIL